MNNVQNNLNNNNKINPMNNVQNNLIKNNNINPINNMPNNLNNNNNQINNVQNNNNNNQENSENNQNYLNENIQITTISDANEMIRALIRENNNLRSELSLLNKNFENYRQTMELNCFYNQFDINAYQLDKIYNSLESRIIQSKEEFGLINRGYRHLFNKNIVSFQQIYSSSNDEFELSQFEGVFNQLEYFILLVSLRENSYRRRFGIFCSKNHMAKISQLNEKDNKQIDMNLNSHVESNINNQMNPGMGMGIPMRMSMPMQMGMGMQMGMPMMNNENNVNNVNNQDNSEEEIIFDSNLYLLSCFLFSLEDLKIYYKDNIINAAPNFIMKYNNRYKCLLGSEGIKIMLQNQTSPDFILYKLSGKHDFNIKSMELYVVKV
jgi:hypothetical protein